MNKILAISLLLCTNSFAQSIEALDRELIQMDKQIKELSDLRAKKEADLENCANSVKNFKIAGISTLSLTGVLATTNIVQGVQRGNVSEEIDSIQTKRYLANKPKEESGKKEKPKTETEKKLEAIMTQPLPENQKDLENLYLWSESYVRKNPKDIPEGFSSKQFQMLKVLNEKGSDLVNQEIKEMKIEEEQKKQQTAAKASTESNKESALEKEIKSGLVVLDFGANWCSHCKALDKKLEEVSKDYPNVKIIKVDIDAEKKIASNYNLLKEPVPILIFLKDGKETDRLKGNPKEDKEIINRMKKLQG